MSRSFNPRVATTLIKENPGRSAEEIVRDALGRGIITSSGQDPLRGQMGALVKMYLGQRLPEVTRDTGRRPYRYYPKHLAPDVDSAIPQQTIPSRPISLILTSEQDEILKALVSAGRFSAASDALKWLVDQGIKVKGSEINHLLSAYREFIKQASILT